MKKVILMVTLMASQAIGSEFCINLEYAELKDMSKEELVAEYCSATLQHNNAVNSLKATKIGDREYLDFRSARDDCFATKIRTLKMLEKKFKMKDEPKCK